MKKIQLNLWCVLCLCITAGERVSAAESGRILDRLVIEVEKIPFTQRQFEIYVAMKGLLVEGDKPQEFVTAANYRAFLDRYIWDMIVEYEAQRLGSFQPERRIVLAAKDTWDAALQKDPVLRRFAKNMACDFETVKNIATTILRVRNFIESKERQNSRNTKESTVQGVLDLRAEWYTRLEQRTAYRIYDGARDYQVIVPERDIDSD